MRTFVTFLLVLGICQANSVLEDVNDKEANLKYRLPADIVLPTAYNLHITPNIEASTFEGEVDIRLTALITNNSLVLNSKELSINNVKFVDLNTSNTLENEWTVDPKYETLNITIKTQFEENSNYSLQIQYNGTLKNNRIGFYKSKTRRQDGIMGYIATTQFKPTYARRAFPCWDEPIYKAKFNITLTHNSELKAISNMDVLKTEKGRLGDTSTTSFKETPLMSTYLVAFMISDCQMMENDVGNFTYRVWTGMGQMMNHISALKWAWNVLDQLNTYTNISYQTYMPDKIDQAWVTDFSFYQMSAAENWGFVIYRDEISYNDRLSVTKSRVKIDALKYVAHELTHQWFGNLVTPKWWTYVWMSEGFATYFQYFIGNMVAPEWRLDELQVVESMHVALGYDGHTNAKPLNQDVLTPEQILNVFNDITYQKGASILRMMFHTMTEIIFHRSARFYLRDNALKNVDSRDLFGSYERALKESGIKWKHPVEGVMDNWFNYPGYPVLTVKRVKEGYHLTQEPFTSYANSTKWWIPVTYVEEPHPYFNQTSPVEWFSPDEESHTVESKQKTGWFIFNPQQTGFYRVNYEEENWKELMKELNKGKNNKIHILNRAQILDDPFILAGTKRLNYTVAMDLSLYLTHEDDYVPWQPAFRHLDFLRTVLRMSKKYYIFTRYVEYLLKTITKNVGYEPKENDTDLVNLLRIDAMKWACEVGVKECLSYTEKTYERWVRNPLEKLDVNLRTEILCGAFRRANVSMWPHITTSDEGVRKEQQRAMACSNSTDTLNKFLNSSIDSDSPISFGDAVSLVLDRQPDGFQRILNFLYEYNSRVFNMPYFQNVMTPIIRDMCKVATSQGQLTELGKYCQDRYLDRVFQRFEGLAGPKLNWNSDHGSNMDNWLTANSHLFQSPDNKNTIVRSLIIASIIIIVSYFLYIYQVLIK